MLLSNSLRGRMVAAYVLLAVIISGVFAGSMSFILLAIEHQLIVKRLDRAVELWAADAYRTDLSHSSDLGFLSGGLLPEAFSRLDPGHHELQLEGRALHVLIRDANGQRYAVVDDQSDFEELETWTYLALGTTFLGGVALALVTGLASASRVIRPLSRLASAVQDEQRVETLPGLETADEIGVLARAIDGRTNQLSQALDRERWFTADVSHELRTPLTVMLGAAEVLSRRLQDRPDLLLMTERIRRNAADTAQQVTALLQLSRTPESSQFIEVAMRPLVEREIERCQPLLRDKSLVIELAPGNDVVITAIPELVAIAVSNLLRNACLHTEQGVISVFVDASGITVEDQGTGLPETVRARLFERQPHGREESYCGSGLGLSIVKRVADHLGWTVHHADKATGGSRFFLQFPQAATAR